jgi:hypothetical protein
VRAALAEAEREWAREGLHKSTDDFNLFETIDSFAVVELLLQTEAAVEREIGRYVPLADETVLDFEQSPLRRLGSWIDYVREMISRG